MLVSRLPPSRTCTGASPLGRARGPPGEVWERETLWATVQGLMGQARVAVSQDGLQSPSEKAAGEGDL